MTGKSIETKFFLENKLPLLMRDVAVQDPDGDGFLNEDEWRHKTDPQDKQSRPPYYSKLFLLTRMGTP